MSWSVSATGKVDSVILELERQFKLYLCDPPLGISDPGERETVWRVSEMVSQCLNVFAGTKAVSVSAYGHMTFDDPEAQEGPTQTLSVSIQPTFFT